MPNVTALERVTMITTDIEDLINSFAQDIDEGLKDTPKHIPSRYFYDYRGSLLFEEICQLPEYYLTRAETEILETCSEEIISYFPPDTLLVELGSGSSIKTQLIIEELLNQYNKALYSPIDISQRMLRESSISLLEKYPNLEIISVAAEFNEGLRQIDMHNDQPKLILWLGSSIGNFKSDEAIEFLNNIVKILSPNDFLLIGFDLQKEKNLLVKAYNDSQDVTAEFNLNLLSRINRELGGKFDLDKFVHKAIYNGEKNRIEMYLISTSEQEIHIADLNSSYHFNKNERIHTENSFKFSLKYIDSLADQVGMKVFKQWFDSKKYFNLTLFKPNEC